MFQKVRSFVIGAIVVCCWPASAIAQPAVTPTVDNGNTLTVVNDTGSASSPRTFTVTGGTQRLETLFHSFEDLSPEAANVLFQLDPNTQSSIDYVIGRVSGNSASNINGKLTLTGGNSPDLFLINPNGITFGPNASLSLPGSFAASTADSILFNNTLEFNARNANSAPLLTVSAPIGLQMAAASGAITVEGTGHNMTFNPFNFSFDRTNRFVGMQVSTGQTLALLGNGISLPGGGLTAAGGRIDLGSVAQPATVSLLSRRPTISKPNDYGLTLGYDGITDFNDIALSQTASVEVSGPGGGEIQLQSRNLSVIDDSIFLADTLQAGKGGLVTVHASEAIDIVGSDFPILPTGFSQQAAFGSTGQGGSMTVKTPELTVIGAAFITVGTDGAGNGGNLTIDTDVLSLLNGGQILTATGGSGNSGNLFVRANESVDISGNLAGFVPSGLFTGVERTGSGNGGNLRLETNRLRIAEGTLYTGTNASGNGGSLTVVANEIEINTPANALFTSDLTVSTFGSGKGGSMLVIAERLILANGGQLAAIAEDTGSAGTLSLDIDEIMVSGGFQDGAAFVPSRITASTIGDGAAGSVNIAAETLSVSNGAEVNVSSQSTADAGSINIVADSILLDRNGSIVADVNGGSQGNLNLTAKDALVLRRGSLISTNATGLSTGGNISVDATTIVGVPKENSDIVANATLGSGGRININTQGIFGLAFRDNITDSSDITASSEFGVSGTVEINNVLTNPGTSLVKLPATLKNADDQIASACRDSSGNQFIASGRGGITVAPSNAIASNRPVIDIRELSTLVSKDTVLVDDSRRSPATIFEDPRSPLPEATSWNVNNHGQVELLTTAASPAVPIVNCLTGAIASGSRQ